MTTHIDRLRKAYAITVGGKLLAGAGSYRVGAVAVVMPDEFSATARRSDAKRAAENVWPWRKRLASTTGGWLRASRGRRETEKGGQSKQHAPFSFWCESGICSHLIGPVQKEQSHDRYRSP